MRSRSSACSIPRLQGQRFDPDGAFVKQWLPELARVPIEFVHEPWKMSAADQRKYGVVSGRDYPAPIVDHRFRARSGAAALSDQRCNVNRC